MSTNRNQRRNRQLAVARERVRELEFEVARLRADLADTADPWAYATPRERDAAQHKVNLFFSDVLDRIAGGGA